ncbi:MAG: hypothetical protein RB292_03410 [Patescibacteria group bacterium]|jgi:dolichol kinase|nr:hypothetical protein [Patescibacteria group bacterium]
MHNETKRQAVHILLFGLAFVLKFLSVFQSLLILIFLLVLVLFIFPRLKIRSHFYRHFEKQYRNGAVTYFLVLLTLILIFPLKVVAVSWGILALGDGMATLIGRNFKTRKLPWNLTKSYAGSLAFVVFGALGAGVVLKWFDPILVTSQLVSVSFKTAVVAAIAESLPLKIDDNITVAVVSAVVVNFLI